MNSLALIYLILIIFSIFVMSLSLTYYSQKDKAFVYMFIFIFSIFTLLWLFCVFILQIAHNSETILFFHEFKYISVIGLPILFYIFSYINYHKKYPSLQMKLSLIMSYIILLTLVFTNPLHHLFRASFEILETSVIIVSTSNNILYYLIVAFSYALLVLSCLNFLRSYTKKLKFYRHSDTLFLIGISFPILANLAYQFIYNYYDIYFDITPLAFFATLLTFSIALFMFNPKKITQVARNQIYNHMGAGSIFVDHHHEIFDINQQVSDLIQMSSVDTLHKNIDLLKHPLFNILRQLLDSPGNQSLIYKHNQFPVNNYYLVKSNPVYDKKERFLGTVFLLTDVSELQHTLNQLDYIGNHDDLTGVYNRYYFQRMLIEMDVDSNYPIAIIVGDINGLKTVNDSLGHSSGDSLLVEVAEKLVQSFRQDSKIFRIGGDEFVIILHNTTRDEIIDSINKIETYNFSFKNQYSNVGISLDFSIKYNNNVNLSELFKRADANMYRKKILLGSSTRDNNLLLLKKILSGKSIETIQHLERTSYLCQLFSKKLHLDHNQSNNLVLLSQLHDIGKTVIPDHILFKPSSLNEDEWAIMKTHSLEGYNILLASPSLMSISNLVLHHHEKYDGTGYPNGLVGKEIPYLSRIMTIIDSYDAMISVRVYKKAMTKEDAIAELNRCSGTQFDPYLCELFIELIHDELQ